MSQILEMEYNFTTFILCNYLSFFGDCAVLFGAPSTVPGRDILVAFATFDCLQRLGCILNDFESNQHTSISFLCEIRVVLKISGMIGLSLFATLFSVLLYVNGRPDPITVVNSKSRKIINYILTQKLLYGAVFISSIIITVLCRFAYGYPMRRRHGWCYISIYHGDVETSFVYIMLAFVNCFDCKLVFFWFFSISW